MRWVPRLALPTNHSDDLAARRERLLGCPPYDARVDSEWRQLYSSGLHAAMRRVLEEQHQYRCVYCESTGSATTIEHYYPKKQFPYHTFEWFNLTLACMACQSYKREPLRFRGVWPMVIDPLNEPIEGFLYISPYDGRMMPALELAKDSPDYARAAETITRLRLNERGLPAQRAAVASDLKDRLEDFRHNPSPEMKARVLRMFAADQRWPAVAWQIIENPGGPYLPLVEFWRLHNETV